MSPKPQISQYLTPQEKLAIFRKIETNIAAGFMLAMEIFDEHLGAIIEKKEIELTDFLQAMDREIQRRELKDGADGEPGPQGDPGDEPSDERLLALIKQVMPEPKNGVDGKSYILTDQDIKNIATLAASLVGIPPVDTTFHDKIKAHAQDIENLKKMLSIYGKQTSKGQKHGGGDTVLAGTGISITTNSSGMKTITNTGASSTIYTETPSGSINGSNVTFTTAHNITTVLNFALNGQYIHPSEYSVSGSTITFVVAPDASLSAASFSITYQ